MATRIIVIHGWPGLAAAMTLKPCRVCGEPVDLEAAHWPHRADCPNLIQDVDIVCDCDEGPVHGACCPNCQAAGEQMYDLLVALALGLDGDEAPRGWPPVTR